MCYKLIESQNILASNNSSETISQKFELSNEIPVVILYRSQCQRQIWKDVSRYCQSDL